MRSSPCDRKVPVDFGHQPEYGYGVIARSRAALPLLFVGVLAIVALLLLPSREPSYQGKNLDQWLAELHYAGNIEDIRRASAAIRAMGTNVLPYLVGYLRHQDSPAKLKMFLFAERRHFAWFPRPRLDPFLGPSYLALKALGKSAAPAIPDLLKMFEEPATSPRGGLGLYSIGPASVPAFRHACESANEAIRIEAASYLALLTSRDNSGQKDDPTWDALFILNLKPKARIEAPSPERMAKLLFFSQQDAHAAVRRASVEALGHFYTSSFNDRPWTVPAGAAHDQER